MVVHYIAWCRSMVQYAVSFVIPLELRMDTQPSRLLIMYARISPHNLRWALDRAWLQIYVHFMVFKNGHFPISALTELTADVKKWARLIELRFLEDVYEVHNVALRLAVILRQLVEPLVVNEQVDVEVAENGELLTTLEQRLSPLELCIALLATVLYSLQGSLFRHLIDI